MANDKYYRLDDQIGFLLRQASQRHATIFSDNMPSDLTAMQFAAMAKLAEHGPCSQNRLGRQVSMDAATIKGVIDRLTKRGLVEVSRDPVDRRRLNVALTDDGAETVASVIDAARSITELTLEPLSQQERATMLKLLRKIG